MFVEYDKEGFGRCTSKSLNNGIFDKMTLLDSAGNLFAVTGVLKVEPMSPFWMWPFEVLMHNSRRLKAKLDTDFKDQLDIEKAKAFVIQKVESQKLDWRSGIGMKNVIKDIEEASSIEAVIQAIQPHHLKKRYFS